MSIERSALVDHMEKYLETIQRGWKASPDGYPMKFQIVECLGGRISQARVFSTLGLSDFPLRSSVSEKTIRQELLIAVPESFGRRNIPPVLQQLGSTAIDRGFAFLRGEVVERSNPIVSGKPFYGFYTSIPITLPE